MEVPLDDARQFLAKMTRIGRSVLMIGVEPAVPVGHHHDQRQPREIKLNPAPPHPHGRVIGKPVKQIKHRERTLAPVGQKNLGTRLFS